MNLHSVGVRQPSAVDHPAGGQSEDALAAHLVIRDPARRFCAGLGGWYVWDGTRYVRDETTSVYQAIREMLRDVVDDKASLRRAATVAGIAKLASTDPAYARPAGAFDGDIWSLNTPGGLLDLRTGDMRPHDPSMDLTRVTAVAPGGVCPRWLEFLRVVTDGDDELADYLQRLAGYSLTGSTAAQILAFLHGEGANGKSVFLSTLRGVFGDYGRAAPIETFTVTAGTRHETEIAWLRGARLVVASETERGRRWAESRIKALTGGDPVVARVMRADPFEFTPQFTLVLAGNHRPALSTVDEAIRRRLHLIPFNTTIPPGDRDPELPEKLRAEWPGILAWALEGLRDYLDKGLAPPAAVRAATEEYFEAEDCISAWLSECCECRDTFWEKTTPLFRSWATWARSNGYEAGTQSSFASEMKKRGFEAKRHGLRGRYWDGVRLRDDGPDSSL